MSSYDLIVIGAGPGGYLAAIKAAQLKKKVALIEKNEVGGTCLNVGCVPTKTLIHSAELLRTLTHSEELGIHVADVTVDFEALYHRKNTVVTKLRQGIESLLKANHVDYISGTCSFQVDEIQKDNLHIDNLINKTFTKSHIPQIKVMVGDQILSSEHVLIATGATPVKPPIKGIELEGVITSNELLTEGKSYEHLVIIGGGVIGVEFATIYNALGSKVTIIESMERLLPNMDREISQNLSLILKKRGVDIYTGAKVDAIEKDGSLICHYTEKGEQKQIYADGILIATGRRANTSNLGLDAINLPTVHGHIKVNEQFKTSVPNVYAIGDVILDGIQLAHVASAQGINAVAMMFGEAAPYNLDAVPSCIYTAPEIATVGFTADEAKAKGIPILQGKALMSANSKSVIEMSDRGFIKLIFEAENQILIGAQLMCTHATDIIGELCTAVANRLTARQLASVIRPHPTFCEAVGEAIEDALGESIHAMPKRI